MNKYFRKNKKKVFDFKNQIIKKQINEIDDLKATISELEIGCADRDRIINSIDDIRNDLFEVVGELRNKSEEYDKLIADVKKMRDAMNQLVFNGKWKLIRLFLR